MKSTFTATSVLGWLASLAWSSPAYAQEPPASNESTGATTSSSDTSLTADSAATSTGSAATSTDSPPSSSGATTGSAASPSAASPSPATIGPAALSSGAQDSATSSALSLSTSSSTTVSHPTHSKREAASRSEAAPGDFTWEQWKRTQSLREQNTLSGSTGLHRVHKAGSGAPGTLRFGLAGGFFSQTGFLCQDDNPCPDPVTQVPQTGDAAQRFNAQVHLSFTPFSFLEVFASLRNSATSNSLGRPQVLQVVGDTSIGFKAFTPAGAERIFSAGAEAELGLFTGTGGVGLHPGATSFALRALSSLDFNQRREEKDRVPLRAHLNLGYYFDNSASTIQRLESTPPPLGRGSPVERTERYGLHIARVDAFELGLGLEYLHDYFRPFIEWTADIPVNRQGYNCEISPAARRGDQCLARAAGFQSTPSRLTVGTRLFPWQASGLALTAALDLGTGGTRTFLEETTPETPYTVWFGLAYAVDTTPEPQRVLLVPAAQDTLSSLRPPRRIIVGQVLDASGEAVIPDALLRFENHTYTGMIADQEGRFRSADLPAGEYNLRVYAEQYREGFCQVILPESLPSEIAPGAAAPGQPPFGQPLLGQEAPETEQQTRTDHTGPVATTGAANTASVVIAENGDWEIPLTCHLKELPRVGNILGLLVDAQTGGPVLDATVTITDKLGRSLTLDADDQGSLLFQNVPFGTAVLQVSAPGYLSTALPVTIDSRRDQEVHLLMNPRPESFSIEVGKRELRLTRPIEFIGATSNITASSQLVLEELATLLQEDTQLSPIEIQVHTDDTEPAESSRVLSQEQADALKQLLIQLGVEEERLSARGYGPDQPLVPNVSDANREKNRRVQILLSERN